MAQHYNIYYLFLEDMQAHPLPPPRAMEIRKNIEKFYETLKPPDPPDPLTITKAEKA